MKNKLNLNKYNLPQELEEYSQLVSYFSQIMADAKYDWVIASRMYSEISEDKKEEQKIVYAEIYKRIMDNDNLSDVKAKQFAYADPEYKSFLENKNKEIKKIITDLAEKERAFENAKSDYYQATNKRFIIQEEIKLLLGGFFEINTNKIKDEVEGSKKKKIITKKNKEEN